MYRGKEPTFFLLAAAAVAAAGSYEQIPIKGCRDVLFSNGGQYFAAINGITLSIYNTYTCECVGNLRGHNGKVGGRGGRQAAMLMYVCVTFGVCCVAVQPRYARHSVNPCQPLVLMCHVLVNQHLVLSFILPRDVFPIMQIRAMCWSSNDSRVVSAGADGAVYEWRLSDLRREKENVLKGCQYK